MEEFRQAVIFGLIFPRLKMGQDFWILAIYLDKQAFLRVSAFEPVVTSIREVTQLQHLLSVLHKKVCSTLFLKTVYLILNILVNAMIYTWG